MEIDRQLVDSDSDCELLESSGEPNLKRANIVVRRKSQIAGEQLGVSGKDIVCCYMGL